MKRDYYRELDHLREQLSRKKRDPSIEPDNVWFFDVAAYRLPSWETIVEKLDAMRMKRELLLHQLGGRERIKRVPVNMLCQKCRSKFQDPDGEESSFCQNQYVQTDVQEVADAQAQTDARLVTRPLPRGGHILEA